MMSLDRRVRRDDRAAGVVRLSRPAESQLFRLAMIILSSIATLGVAGLLRPIVEATIQLDEQGIRQAYEERARRNARCAEWRAKGEWHDGCPVHMPVF